jgi:hypothetical protein
LRLFWGLALLWQRLSADPETSDLPSARDDKPLPSPNSARYLASYLPTLIQKNKKRSHPRQKDLESKVLTGKAHRTTYF